MLSDINIDDCNTLIIKNISPQLSYNEREELFVHFGALCVTNLPHYSFAVFENHESASRAMKRLHQLKVIDKLLKVEFSISSKRLPLLCTPAFKEPHLRRINNDESIDALKERRIREYLNRIHHVSPSLGLNYYPSPILKYKYPPASEPIVNCIAHTLINNVKFYTQVLHLMNKMNLPPPFGECNEINIINLNETNYYGNSNVNVMRRDESESEYEMESDGDDGVRQSFGYNFPKKRIVKKLKTGIVGEKRIKRMTKKLPLKRVKSFKSDDIFEKQQNTVKTNIEINIRNDVLQQKMPETVINTDEIGNFGIIKPQLINDNPQDSGDDAIPDPSQFITEEELSLNRLHCDKFKDYPVFKDYNPGQETCRLYLKNIAKQTQSDDLKRIYGRYINWNNENDRNMFDIQLMKSGRMKGQCFVTFPNERIAQKAINDTNGYMLHGKPIVAVYARSARPKTNEDK